MSDPTPPAVSEALREAVAPAYGIIDPDYARVFTQARCLAWSEGYALMMHGSFTRDLDLIAVPWTDQACEPEHLVNRIAATADLTMTTQTPGMKAHGRLAWTLLFQGFGDPRFIDLSIVPRALEIARLTGERDAANEKARETGTRVVDLVFENTRTNARAEAAEAALSRLQADRDAEVVKLRAALEPFAKLDFSFDGFSLDPAEMVVLGRLCGRFWPKEHDHLQRAIHAARAALTETPDA